MKIANWKIRFKGIRSLWRTRKREMRRQKKKKKATEKNGKYSRWKTVFNVSIIHGIIIVMILHPRTTHFSQVTIKEFLASYLRCKYLYCMSYLCCMSRIRGDKYHAGSSAYFKNYKHWTLGKFWSPRIFFLFFNFFSS